MTGRRNTRTDLELINSGQWAKVGRKHFRRFDGAEVRYDCNAWGWRVNGGRFVWKTLEVAVQQLDSAEWTHLDRIA